MLRSCAGLLLNDMRMYNPTVSAWADLTGQVSEAPPPPRRFPAAVLANGKLYIFGGFGPGGEE